MKDTHVTSDGCAAGAHPARETRAPGAVQLTAPRRKLYPRLIVGRFKRVRWLISAILQAVLFAGPWITYGGRQAIQIDLAGRRLHFFAITFWPQDTYFALVALIALAVLLFLSTAIAGRMWCGYACPQTLLTECFVHVERFFEGERARRMRLDKMPWTADKVARKLAKWSVWTGMALWLGVTFAGYFQDASQLLRDLAQGHVAGGTTLLIVLVAAVAWFDFGWFREQLCHYACPYARFQGAMFDADSLLIGYDAKRGEPRGKARDGTAGDCVDCGACVQVCPAGIDIRQGLQMECIACTACMDACDSVMDKLRRERGLVGYSSLSRLEGRPERLLRPRVVAYAVLLAALVTLFVHMLLHRPLLVLDVIRKPGPRSVYLTTADGQISNLYHIKLINKDGQPHRLGLSIEGFAGARLVAPQSPISMEADSDADFDVFVIHPAEDLKPLHRLIFVLQDEVAPGLSQRQGATFVGPVR